MSSIKRTIGAVITLIGLALFIYVFFFIAITQGSVGVRGQVTLDPILGVVGFLLILAGPALWLGEVPVNIKKFVEAKTGKKV
ncbi:MAG: hypothetical protein QXN04_00480 [Pyrobaculum sp.]